MPTCQNILRGMVPVDSDLDPKQMGLLSSLLKRYEIFLCHLMGNLVGPDGLNIRFM